MGATTRKQRANTLFKDGHYVEARAEYLKALSYLSTLSNRNDDEDEVCVQALEVRRALLLNNAACDLKTGDYQRAADTCCEVLYQDGANLKARYRRGLAYSFMGRLDEAADDLRSVAQVATDAATVRDTRRELARVRKLMESDRQKDRDMAKRMMGLSAKCRSNVSSVTTRCIRIASAVPNVGDVISTWARLCVPLQRDHFSLQGTPCMPCMPCIMHDCMPIASLLN